MLKMFILLHSCATWKPLYTTFFINQFMPDEKLARALGSKIRRDMLCNLIKAEMSVNEIAEIMNLSEINASKHLKKLYDLGMIDTRTEGRKRYYSLKFKETKNLIKEFNNVANILGKIKND